MNKFLKKLATTLLGFSLAAGSAVSIFVKQAFSKQVNAAEGAEIDGFTQASSVDDITDRAGGNFLIAAVTSTGTIFLPSNVTSGGKIVGTASGSITSANIANHTFIIESEGNGQYSILGTSKYYAYNSSTNFKYEDSVSNSSKWTFSFVNGRCRISNVATTTRLIVYRAGSTNQFGAYASSNVNNTEYYDCEIYYEDSGTSTQTVTAVAQPVAGNNFQKTYTDVDNTTQWSTTGLSAAVTIQETGSYAGSITYNFSPSTPLDYVKGGNTSLSITATAGGITSSALVINDMSVTAKDGMTEDNPISPSEAKTMVGTATSGFDGYYVAGTVVSANNPSSGYQTYFISDDGTETDQIEIYKGKYLDNADFDSNNAVKAGDEVTVYGDLTYYSGGSIVEFKQGSVVVAYRDPSATATTTYYTLSAPASQSIAVGDTYNPTIKAIKDSDSSETTLSAGSYTLSSSNTSVATVDSGTGAIRAVAKGSATITVSKDKVIDLVNDNTDEYASTSIAITVTGAQHSGTFASFATDIVEGYYVICDGTVGLGNTISSSRFTNATVTFTNDKIVAPDMSLVWHITQSGDYWLIQNMETSTYAGSTSSKNTGAMLSDSTSNYAKWTISYSSGFSFVNYGRTQASSDTGNAYLKHNGNNGWAAYASGTGTAPQLYKLEETALAVTLSSSKAYLTSIGDTGSLTATAYSDTAKTKQITGLVAADFTFTSSNPSIVSVTENGTITAVATGSVTITASKDNVTSDSVTVKVVTVSVDLINDGSVLEELQEGTFMYSWSSNELKPTSPVVTWSSSDSNSIEVDSSTGDYTAGFDGTSATITVSVVAEGYTFTASREFSVVSTVVAAHSIDVEEGNSVVVYVGSTKDLTITVLGSDGTTPATNQNVICASSKTSVLTVTNAGVITPLSRGTATITITDEGNLCDPVVVNVRVRNVVTGASKIMGVLDATGYDAESDISSFYTTQNNYDAPTSATTNGGKEAANYIKLATSKAGHNITLTFADELITKVVVVGKRYSANKSDPTMTGATADKSYTAEDTTVTYTFTSAVDEIVLSATSGNQFYCKSITVYGPQSDDSLTSDAQAVYAFEETYMHLDDYNSNLGYCKDNEHNYYQKDATQDGAKRGFNSLSPEQRALFVSNEAFADAWARLQAWATANGDSLNASNQLAAKSGVSPLVNIIGENTNTVAIIVIISMVSVTAIGGYFFLRKRKENI